MLNKEERAKNAIYEMELERENAKHGYIKMSDGTILNPHGYVPRILIYDNDGRVIEPEYVIKAKRHIEKKKASNKFKRRLFARFTVITGSIFKTVANCIAYLLHVLSCVLFLGIPVGIYGIYKEVLYFSNGGRDFFSIPQYTFVIFFIVIPFLFSFLSYTITSFTGARDNRGVGK